MKWALCSCRIWEYLFQSVYLRCNLFVFSSSVPFVHTVCIGPRRSYVVKTVFSKGYWWCCWWCRHAATVLVFCNSNDYCASACAHLHHIIYGNALSEWVMDFCGKKRLMINFVAVMIRAACCRIVWASTCTSVDEGIVWRFSTRRPALSIQQERQLAHERVFKLLWCWLSICSSATYLRSCAWYWCAICCFCCKFYMN